MRRTIVVADKDERLQQAFMTVFSREHYEIVYASTGREVEKIAGRMNPDIYVVNVNLPKTNGIEVHKRLQKSGYLDKASFFFLKDEADETELLGYQADGVIEKPINFFRVYETITAEDEVIELTDLVEEKGVDGPREARERRVVDMVQDAPYAGAAEEAAAARGGGQGDAGPGTGLRHSVGRQLRDAMDNVGGTPADAEGMVKVLAEARPAAQAELEQQFKVVLNQAMEEAADKLSGRLAPVLTQYVEDYVRQMLLEITEKVIREEIDKLLKEPAE